MKTFIDEFKKGSYVRVIDPMDQHFDCEAQVMRFEQESGEYLIEFVSGDAKGSMKKYSSADLGKS
jgi:hypothetical protein